MYRSFSNSFFEYVSKEVWEHNLVITIILCFNMYYYDIINKVYKL